ncbi:MAG: protocatechuate 3,4-dioxygenase [Pseudomonadota bacterium]
MKRRKLLKTFVAAATLPAGSLAASGKLALTGKDVEGPFYPVQELPMTASLLLSEKALGDPLQFSGRILDTQGNALNALRIDIWQCNAMQAYNHPADNGTQDPSFRGFAAQLTDANGAFTFDTIVPVSYGGRPPHIHVKIWQNKTELLTTQVYLEGHRGSKKRKINPVKIADNSYRASFDFVV